MKIEAPKAATTWKDVVADALRELGGHAHLKQITEIALQHPKAANNTRVEEKVRQVVRAYSLFEPIDEGSGYYCLLEPNAEFLGIGTSSMKELTERIQWQLLFIGRAQGFETWAPADDQAKRVFDGKPLRELVTLENELDGLTRLTSNESKAAKLIDVLWFREEHDELIPHCAFEIEYKTDVIIGLERLNQLPPILQTRLFIIGPNEAKKAEFGSLLNSLTWKPRTKRFYFRSFHDVKTLFVEAANFHKAREANDVAMQTFFN